MTVCEHCEYRNGYECDDGWNRSSGGCSDFHLDWDTLTKKQKKSVLKYLKFEENEEE